MYRSCRAARRDNVSFTPGYSLPPSLSRIPSCVFRHSVTISSRASRGMPEKNFSSIFSRVSPMQACMSASVRKGSPRFAKTPFQALRTLSDESQRVPSTSNMTAFIFPNALLPRECRCRDTSLKCPLCPGDRSRPRAWDFPTPLPPIFPDRIFRNERGRAGAGKAPL